MPKESMKDKQRRALTLISRLDEVMPDVEIELDYENDLQLLLAVLLAAQTTDKGVNKATPALFARYPTAADYAAATPEEIQQYIKTVGLFRNKSKAVVALGKMLVERHAGVVPRTRAELTELPGVGNKTAGVVTMHIEGGERAFPVDTHVTRLSYRMGFSSSDKPDRIELDLRGLLPEELWFKAHQLLVWHGRRVCHALNPECRRCSVSEWCPKRGVKEKGDSQAARRRQASRGGRRGRP